MRPNENTIKAFNDTASWYVEKFMSFSLYDDTYDQLCNLISGPNAKIFELGCGPGNITKYLLSKRPDFQIEGIDLAPNMLRLAKELNPSADFYMMDCRDISSITKKFNAVVCGFCLPYLTKEECRKMFTDVSSLLIEDGLFYFSTIEDDYLKSAVEYSSDKKNSVYVYYHEEKYLKEYLGENNFEIKGTFRKDYLKSPGQNSVHLVMIAQLKK